jgi:C4-dicarboxylate transporter DctQ subunit
MISTPINLINDVYGKVTSGLERGIQLVCVVFLSAMVTIVLYGVFMRYIMLSAVGWAEEAPIYMMIWVAFLAGSLGIRRGTHIGVEAFIKYLPRKLRIIILILTSLCIMFFLSILFGQGYQMCISGFKHQMSTSLEISMGWAILAVPVGSFFMMIEVGKVILEALGEMFHEM